MRTRMNHSDKTHLIDYLRTRVRDCNERTALIGKLNDGKTITLNWFELGQALDAVSIWIESKYQSESKYQRMPDTSRCLGYASDNSIGSVIIALACMNLGLIEFPFDHRLTKAEMKKRWSPIGGLWVEPSMAEQYLVSGGKSSTFTSFDLNPNRPPDSPALVLWTSGTTGTPKGVTLSNQNLLGNARAKLKAVPEYPEDRRLNVLPLCHGYARTCDLGTWLISGCTLAVTLGYHGLKSLASSVAPTLLNVVPSLAKRLLTDKEVLGLDQLRLLGCGGAGLGEEDFINWSEGRGVTVIQGYGLTETSPVICSATPAETAPGVVGNFVEGWEHKISEGQLYVRGSHVMRGYWDDPHATQGKIDSEGWLATGDQVEFNPETKQVKILGRVDDVIVLNNAIKIQPQTSERRVNTIGGVCNAILINRQGLELWVDLEPTKESVENQRAEMSHQIRQLLGEKIGLQSYSIHYFSPPLEEAELTLKGTLRREQIMLNRFSNQAGS